MSNWRKIEAALIELLREEGFEIEQYKGDSFIIIRDAADDGLDKEINIGDFAKELEARIA